MIGAITAGLYGTGVPPVTSSYESIATYTIGSGGVSDITFSSIPSTYTHLQLRFNARSQDADTNAFVYMRFNSDSATNYSFHLLRGDGSSASSAGYSNQTIVYDAGQIPANSAASNLFGGAVLDVLDYANVNKYKTTRSLNGYDANGSGSVFLSSGNWRSTSAISSIYLFTQGGSGFSQYSQFALFGIKG